MKYISLFSGVGGFDKGFDDAGMTCVAQVEIDKQARKVLNTHWPKVPVFEDVKTVGKHNLPKADLICGGFPCQDISISSNNTKGLDGERSGLWFEFHRIIGETQPDWVVIENVANLLEVNQGNDFGTLLYGLVELGYSVCWRILDSRYFGVPQRRRRLYIVGHRGSVPPTSVLFEPEVRSRSVASNGERSLLARARSTKHNLRGQSSSSWPRPTTFDARSFRSNGEISGTLQAKSSGGWSLNFTNPIVVEGRVRRLTARECERLQGFPDDWTSSISNTHRGRVMGNAVTVSVAKWIGTRIKGAASVYRGAQTPAGALKKYTLCL